MFGVHRRERIAFCEKLGGARLGRVKERVGRNKKTHISVKKCENGRGECVFGLHRRERIAFLTENGQAWLRRSKAAQQTNTF